jgi:hypothetical protein
MKRRRSALLGALFACGSWAAAVSPVGASDHLDGPRATADPPADIADVYAFTSPANPASVVLAMTVTPYASPSSAFASDVDYIFRVRRVVAPNPLTLDEGAPLDILCRFDSRSPQRVKCSTASGVSAEATVGDLDGGGGSAGPMRVFAGLRSDPAFVDRQGLNATIRTGRASFTGQNAWAGANVLALVVEVDARAVLVPSADGGPEAAASDASGEASAAGLPILAIAAETVRRGP